MKKKTVRDLDLAGKRVLLRVDYNVQFDEHGRIEDDLRLRESIPTIRLLQDQGAKVVICSHRGRPEGKVVEELRNAPVAKHLSKLLGEPVASSTESVGPEAEADVARMKPGDVLLLENVRFHAEEEENDTAFAEQLARLGDVFVSDAFGTAHRAHASIVGVAKYLPAVAGLLLEREVGYLGRVTEHPDRPFAVVLGGAKISDKLEILHHLCDEADVICVGGAMANTFLKAQGYAIGDSLCEDDALAGARAIIAKVEARGDASLLLPTDVVIADGMEEGCSVRTVDVSEVPEGWRILDVGPDTVAAFGAALRDVKTAVWNGPLGLFERPPFDAGSLAVARIFAGLSGVTVVGGGETAAVIQRAGVAEQVSHVSTGGGASLAMLEGKPLPGVEALLDC